MSEKAALGKSINTEHPPSYPAAPAYEDVAYEDSYAASPAYPPPQQGKPAIFPTAFTFEYRMFRSISHIYEKKGSEVLFAVKTSRVVTGMQDLVLLSGPDKLSAPLACASLEKGSKTTRTNLRLMPRPGGAFQEPINVSLRGNYSLKHQFEVAVGPNGETETFEWRSSKGKLVKSLVGGYQYGQKLVRMDGPVIPPRASGSGAAGNSDDDDGEDDMSGITSDGKRVVAIGAGERWHYGTSKFRFLNEGATGELGEVFELAAVIGFMRLYEFQLAQGATAISVSNSAAASNAAVAAAT